jgi:predicted Zn-dependent protease
MLGPPTSAGAPRTAGPTRQADREHAKLVAAFGGEHQAPAMRALLSETAARIVSATERPNETYQITILDSPVVNAFVLPSGRLYVTRGLLALANDTSEIAAVLAHEVAHVTLRHASVRLELEARSALVSRVVSDVLGDPDASAAVRDQSRTRIASFSRAQELEADQIGVKTLARAGYDPYGAARFLSALGQTAGLRAAPGGKTEAASPDMLATHPGASDRVALALQAARRIGTPGLIPIDRARYLDAVDGLAHGENPADGVVRGRRFIHPRLGVAFEAPEGIVLENTPRALLGSSADGNRRLLFDAVDAPEKQSLVEVLRSTWSDAVEAGNAENLEINGHPAATAISRGKEWTFRLSAIRIGSTIYRLVLAVRSGATESERAFRHVLDSVRQVPPEEARSLRPLRVQVVTAAEGDTAERLASRMAVPDRPVDRFLILNGLERNSPLIPGERYKIIVE